MGDREPLVTGELGGGNGRKRMLSAPVKDLLLFLCADALKLEEEVEEWRLGRG